MQTTVGVTIVSKRHNCEDGNRDYFVSGFHNTGDRWICPKCDKQYEHVCDEADGCYWILLVTMPKKKKKGKKKNV